MKIHVLIIDDEVQICSILSAYLTDQGYKCTEADSLMAARRHLQSGFKPDIVVLDVMLSDGNGILFIRELRQSPSLADVPIIMMSAHRTKSKDKVVGLEFGADDYLTKPFDLRELQLRVEKLLKQREFKSKRSTEPLPTPSLKIEGDITSVLQAVYHGKTEAQPTKPVETSPVPLASSPIKERSLIKNFLNLLLQPAGYFDTPQIQPVPWFGVALVCLVGMLFGAQHGFSAKSWGTGFVGFILYPAVLAGLIAIATWAIQWIMGFKKKSVPFKNLFFKLSLSAAPCLLAGILGLVYVVTAGGRVGDFTAGPLLILPTQSSSNILGFILRRIDIFELWSVLLGAYAIQSQIGGSRKRIFMWLMVSWSTVVLLITALKGIFS